MTQVSFFTEIRLKKGGNLRLLLSILAAAVAIVVVVVVVVVMVVVVLQWQCHTCHKEDVLRSQIAILSTVKLPNAKTIALL